MQGQFKLKTKLSFSPTKTKDNVYVVKAKIGKKLQSNLFCQGSDKEVSFKRPTSLSAHKNKPSTSKLFKNAHKIESTQTYLPLQKKNRLSNTNQSSPPHSQNDAPIRTSNGMTSSDKKLGISRKSSKDVALKDIQRTVSISYKGKAKSVPIEEQLMTTLSKLILGDQKSKETFQLEILGESSIHGDQENYIDFGDSLFQDQQEVATQKEMIAI